MPHIIVEYSLALEPKIPALLYDLHDALATEGIDKAKIKTRAVALDHAVVGEDGSDGLMIHATLLLLSGRDLPTKKQYGDPLFAAIKSAAPPACAVTLEIREMDPDTYYQ